MYNYIAGANKCSAIEGKTPWIKTLIYSSFQKQLSLCIYFTMCSYQHSPTDGIVIANLSSKNNLQYNIKTYNRSIIIQSPANNHLPNKITNTAESQ